MAGDSRELAMVTAQLFGGLPGVEVLTLSVNAVQDAPRIQVHAASWEDGQRLAEGMGLAEQDHQFYPSRYPETRLVEWRTWSGVAPDCLVLVEVTAADNDARQAVA